MKVYRNIEVNGSVQQTTIFDIGEATYSGTDMGERKITATIKYQAVIDFKVGDYVELDIADLLGGHSKEKFYLFNLPTIKKTARAGSVGDAFEHNVTFYPAQFELNITQMRDILHQNSVEEITSENFIYTGYDEFSFFGGAHTLMRRIMYVLQERFGTEGTAGIDYWDYCIAESVDEDINTALEKVQFDFSGNSVWDALCKLNEEDGVNTDFFIVGRMIYVGFKRPNIVGVDEHNVLQEAPFQFQYGKTSHLPISTNHGNLFSITKSIGNTSPITRLYAYGDSRNLNRFYASDRLRSGRYVSKLMLPSFNNDGKTDWIDSIDGINRYGIREATQSFPEIYPSLRYITYGDLRGIQYVIMIENGGGLGRVGHIELTTPIARVQCYKVIYNNKGVAKLERSYPPDKLAVFIHATGKVIKCVLYPTQTEQFNADYGLLPKEGTSISDAKVIIGSCYCVHDDGYEDYLTTSTIRKEWFLNPDIVQDTEKKHEIELHQIHYTDDYWITDVFKFDDKLPYDKQNVFSREPYSAYCYPHINRDYNNGSEVSDNLVINEIVEVEPVTIVDTDLNKENGQGQKTFVVYMRDFGFMINEQAYSGQYQWLVNGEFQLNFLDGYMAGLNFTVSAKGDGVICAYDKNGFLNPDWYVGVDKTIAESALGKGAFWRLICNRNTDNEYSYMPNAILNPQAGDHVVFLNIYMPDLYILAAEKRLLAEAQKYLNEHDNGDITYSLALDKVRLAQVPAFGLQMREGAVMRIVDDDLQIYTDNEEKYLYSNSNGLLSEVDLSSSPTITKQITDEKVNLRNFDFLNPNIHTAKIDLSYGQKHKLIGIFVKNGKEYIDAEILSITKTDEGTCQVIYKLPQLVISRYGNFYLGYTIQNADELTTNGVLPFKYIFNFEPNKHYTIEIGLIRGDGIDANSLFLTSGIDRLSSVYYPSSEITDTVPMYDGTKKITFEFDTESAFNGKNPYYIALNFANSTEKSVAARLFSIKESNTDTVGEYAKFVDLTIDTLSIKISDSTNEYQVGGSTISSSSRASNGGTTKEITATVKEKRKATTWQAMANEIKDTAIVSSQNTKTNEQLANIARRNYREFEDLKNNIFDPDGSINDVFLQTMLLQVGANSMNYTLDKTKVFNGTYRNIQLTFAKGYLWTISLGSDILRHYVYTEGSQMGTWTISAKDIELLDGDEVYYIALKCERNGNSGEWVVDTVQHKVDEDEDYWYFNYGIIGLANGEHRNLTETRGNVFVYGDNVNAGKIMTFDGDSYFDLTGNSFKLGDQLYFKDGVLTLGGINDGSTDSILSRLNLTEVTANSAQTAANQAKYMNIYSGGNLSFKYYGTDSPKNKGLLTRLPKGTYKTAITSENNGNSDSDVDYEGLQNSCLVWFKTGAGDGYDIRDILYAHRSEVLTISDWGEDVTINETADVVVYTCVKEVIQSVISGGSFPEFPADGTWTINGIQIIGLISDNVAKVNDIANEAAEMASTAQSNFDDLKVGGENLADYDTAVVGNMTKDGNLGFVQVTADTQTQLNLIIDDYHGQSGFRIYARQTITTTGTYSFIIKLTASTDTLRIKADGSKIDTVSTFNFAETIKVGTTLVVTITFTNVRQGSFAWGNVMIQRGNKPTSYQPYIEHITDALRGTTDIAGGLVMTRVMMLKNENDVVTAGMSGLTGTAANKENVLLWGGGTYNDALNASQDSNYSKSSSGEPITTLLKKDGTGKIGIFKISDTQAIVDVPGQGKVVIDASDSNGGITFLDSSEQPIIKMTAKELSNLTDLLNQKRTGTVYFNDNGSYSKNISTESSTATFSAAKVTRTQYVARGGVIKLQGSTYQAYATSTTSGLSITQTVVYTIKNQKGDTVAGGVLSETDWVSNTMPASETYTIEAWVNFYITFNKLLEINTATIHYADARYIATMEFTYSTAERQTMLAKGGLFTFQGDRSYFYYKDGVGLDCQVGDYRLNISESGGFMLDGVPESSQGLSNQGLSKGQLYQENHFVKIV